jgi:type VII secretion protein EccE
VAGIPAGLLVCWQAALLLAMVAIGRPAGQVIGFGMGAAVVVAVTGARPRGRWTHEWAVLWLRYLLRTQRVAGPGQPSAELALLDLAARVEAVSDLEIEEQEVAVVRHGHGITAVLELETGAQPGALVRLPFVVAPRYEPDAPVVSVQLLLHTVHTGPPRAWLAVQVRREAGYPSEQLRGALVGAVRRLRRRLRTEGVAARPLDQGGLREALHTLTRLDLTGAAGAAAVGTEQWRTWWTREVPQECLAVRSWPGAPAAPGAGLLAALAPADPPQTTAVAAQRLRLPVAHGTLRAGDEVLAVEVVVRVAERDRPRLAAAVRRQCDRLAAAGAVVERLDGRQLPAMAATLPTGGFLSGYAPVGDTYAPPPRELQPAEVPPAEVPPPEPVPVPAEPVPVPVPPPAPRLVEIPTAPVQLNPSAPVQVATAKVYLPQPTPTPSLEQVEPAAPAEEPPAPARGQAQVPAPPPPVLARAVVAVATAEPVRGQAQVLEASTAGEPVTPAGSGSTRPPAPARAGPVAVPTTLRGAAAPPPAPTPATEEAATPLALPYPGAAPPPYQPAAAPDPHDAVRAYGASLFTAESARRGYLEDLVALARTPHRSPQLVSVLAGRPGLGASTTAAGLARTLATVRDDYTALLSIDTGPVSNSRILAVCRDHAFTVVDLGAHTAEETPQALALSTRLVVVASADRRATPATKLTLDRASQVDPSLVAGAVIVVVCRNDRQYRRVLRELGSDLSPQAAQIIPIPPDPALRAVAEVNLAKLRAPTKEAYLRLAATLASPQPVPGDRVPHAVGPPPYTASLHP